MNERRLREAIAPGSYFYTYFDTGAMGVDLVLWRAVRVNRVTVTAEKMHRLTPVGFRTRIDFALIGDVVPEADAKVW